MTIKNIVYGRDVINKIKSGVTQLTNAVKTTLGPTGRVVMVDRDFGDPYLTKDGVTVAKEVVLADPLENMAAQLVKQAASKTADAAGDGTTTATILTASIYMAGLDSISAGVKPHALKHGIDLAVAEIIANLKHMAKPVVNDEQLKQVAICSANRDEVIGGAVAHAISKVGHDGVVTIEDGRTLETYVTVVDGMQFDRGFISPYFATNNETMVCEYDEPAIMICDMKLSQIKSFLPALEVCIAAKQPLVIIADDVDGEALQTLVVNRVRGSLQVVAVRAPGFGDRRADTLQDVAVAVGATIVSKDTGIGFDNFKREYLGSCKKIKIDRDTTTIVEGHGDESEIDSRLAAIKRRLEVTVHDFEREKLQERLARLGGGVAQIVVGGATEVEVREKRDRADDALHACKAAVSDGILPGGGVAMLKAAKQLKSLRNPNQDIRRGAEIVRKAVEAPIRQIALNTGIDDGVVLARVLSSRQVAYGYDAANGKYGDMYKFGIIVPTKVECIALQNAASVAGLLLTTDCMMANVPEPKNDHGGI